MLTSIKNIETKEPIKLFLFGSYIVFFVANIYHYLFGNGNFSPKQFIFELIFLCMFLTFTLYNKKLLKINKKIYTKYIFLGISMLYLLSYDFLFISNANGRLTTLIWQCFLVIFSPLFLSFRFFLLASICMLLKFLISIYYFNINYPLELLLVFITIIVTSFLVLISLQFLVQKTKSAYEKQMQETALSVMKIMELKDSYTKGHSVRVAKYATLLAKSTNQYTKSTLKDFYFSCLIHDIGKIGISDKILNKTSPLTQEEYNLIKKHPQLGMEIFRNISLIKDNEAIILSHHERWDGKGYPYKLKGNQIPLCARIVAIADAFDAMTSSRAYRSALSPEEAYERIVKGAGSQFDPTLVETFKTVFPLWKEMIQQN
ncbi:HD-GYP domain-containing protein [Bacillus thuringiensis]|uniref:HD-GYP domain-containing protein n=1 Tax=Bacillus thuringiensis TaxID=1428 RepID=UPI000BFA28E9|nr:HD-GYP domain-containing protein [Bacillus thuringiensis]PFN47362.1 HD family phosphohydrolase [Bacillus thuringiensis]